MRRGRSAWIFVAALAVAACGGGGGGGGAGAGAGTPGATVQNPFEGGEAGLTWVEGEFAPSDAFAARCEVPRTGIDPATGLPYPDRSGSLLHEKHWLRSFSHELYLWYDEIIDRDPAGFATPQSYFDVLGSPARTSSGQLKDRFRFQLPTEVWREFSQSGVRSGYGARWVVRSGQPPRDVVVAFVEPGTPAADLGLVRGSRVREVDGIDYVNTTDPEAVAAAEAALLQPEQGDSHDFTVLHPDGTEHTVTLTAGAFASSAVLVVETFETGPATVGYLLFNDHTAAAEDALVDAVTSLREAGVDELVLDLRYNGGGFLYVASQLAFMIAGRDRTAGRAFERLEFNDKHPTHDPVTGDPLEPAAFRSTTSGRSVLPAEQPLPQLALERVIVLTGGQTCSASESIINSLRGIDFEVVQIGGRTCGKPYGTYPSDNCGTTWFTTMFRGVNDQGFGDYPDGFAPGGDAGVGEPVPGCPVADDFGHDLGEPEEARLAVALNWIESGSCPATPATTGGRVRSDVGGDGDVVVQPHWLPGRVLLP